MTEDQRQGPLGDRPQRWPGSRVVRASAGYAKAVGLSPGQTDKCIDTWNNKSMSLSLSPSHPPASLSLFLSHQF